MNSPLNFDDQQVSQLLDSVSNQLGMDKNLLKEKLMNNDIDFILQNSNMRNKSSMFKILNDPNLLEKFAEYQKYRSALNGRGE